MIGRTSLFRVACLGLFFLSIIAPTAHASPITITQHFGQAIDQMIVNGVLQSVTGDWIFTILTDTSNPDLNHSDPTFDPDFGRFAASITVSNTGLGLVNVGLVSHTTYFEFVNPDGSQLTGITTAGIIGSGVLLHSFSNVINDPNVIEPAFLD